MIYSGVALITGAGGTGIGNATAQAFVKAGCTKLVITDINSNSLSSTESSLRALTDSQLDILGIAGDISSERFISDLFNQTSSHFGRIDYAVNAAGIVGDGKSSTESNVEAFDKVNSVNYRGLWMCVREEIRMMKTQELSSHEGVRGGKGSIVNIASQLGLVGKANNPSYCAGKAAVIALTRCDAVDASPFQIRVNAVCPGIIDTPMVNSSTSAGSNDLGKYVKMAPMERMGVPEEIADVVLFLSGEGASFVQGAAWVVDGGYTIT